MPYIPKQDRIGYDPALTCIIEELNEHDWHPGHLNYLISSLLSYRWQASHNYAEGNKLLGVLDAVAREFYRMKLAPYEEKKRKLEGDV